MRKRPVYWCYFRAEILQIYKFLTEMILADNQRGKDRVPYISTWTTKMAFASDRVS